jgi:F420-dependent oxidoreductase-like protein
MARLGVYVQPHGATIASSIEQARIADRMGVDSIWVTQLANEEDGFVLLSAYAGVTSRARLGTGVIPIYSRHPTALVQAVATLDTLSSGRAMVGLGVGTELTVEWMWGLRLTRPARAMREYVAILRESLETGRSQFEGEHFTARWRYTATHRGEVPIFLAALGPRMLELAGEVADGVMPWLTPPGYLAEHVLPAVARGRARAGKDLRGFEIALPLPVCLTDDRGSGRDVFRKNILDFYARLPPYRRVFVSSGMGDLGLGRMPDEAVDCLGGFGDEDVLRRIVAEYRAAGVTLPLISPYPDGTGALRFQEVLEAVCDERGG